MKRTDIHRPAVIEPANYEFVAFEYLKTDDDLGAAMFLAAERARTRAHMAATGGTYSSHAHGGNCHVCGAAAIYTALFYHKGANVYVRTGLDCAEKLECFGGEAFRKKVSTALEATAGKRKAKATLEAAGLSEAWAICEAITKRHADNNAAYAAWRAANPEPECRSSGGGYGIEEVGAPKPVPTSDAEMTVRDIVSKLVKYGSVSDKALNFVRVLIERINKAPEIAAARAAELEAAKPVPTDLHGKRADFRGTVLTVKEPDEYDRFGSTKMLVKHADGWKLWGTVPSSILHDIARGDEVEFSATIKVSDKDPKFGFWSRPTKARLIKAAEAAKEAA